MRKSRWLVAVFTTLVGGSALGVAAARALVATPAVAVHAAADLPLPALDRMVARLAADARTKSR